MYLCLCLQEIENNFEIHLYLSTIQNLSSFRTLVHLEFSTRMSAKRLYKLNFLLAAVGDFILSVECAE